MDEANLTDSFESAKGDRAYEDSENSREYSESSYALQNDTPLQEDSWDDDYDDSYYDLTYASEEDNRAPIVIVDDTEMEQESCVERTAQMQDEALEENNNDPNNNMDSNEINVMEIPSNEIRNYPVEISDSEDGNSSSGMNLERSMSPKPGCSKDCVSLPDEKFRYLDEILLERTRYILTLISQIHRDSVFDALIKNNDKPVSELKLWDLIPENARLEYPEDILGSNNRHNVKKELAFGSICSTIKRGPDEDICTIGCKRSSSTPDISNSAPMTSNDSIPKVASSSQIGKILTKNEDKSKNDTSLPFDNLMDFTPAETVTKNSLTIPKNSSTIVTNKSSTVATKKLATTVKKASTTGTKNLSAIGISNSTSVSRPTQKSYAIPQQNISVINHGAIPKVYDDSARKSKHQRKLKESAVLAAVKKISSQAQTPLTKSSVGNSGVHRMTGNHLQANVMQPLQQSSVPVKSDTTVSRQQMGKVDRAAFVKEQISEMAHWNRIKPDNQKQQTNLTTTSSSRSNVTEESITNRPVIKQTQQTAPSISQTPNRVICMEIYYKLINIFPNIDRDYIKNLCPSECAPADRDGQLSILIENILERADTVPRIIIDENNDADDSNVRPSTVDEIYENLLGIFPDADPHFLRESAESNFGKPNELKTFVETQLERRNYPTREQYMARLKITEQQRQYTEGFDLKQYLSIIPDPVKQFMDVNRKCKYSTVVFEFLKSHFNKSRVATISRYYTDSFYNLSRTAAALEANGPELKSKRCNAEMLTADILLLQEIAFIKHKKKIIDYLTAQKKIEDAEFEMLKTHKLLLECQCCYDDECVPSKCSSCDNGHLFCNNCIISGTNAKMGDGETRINCFANCGSEFSLSVLQRVLAPTTFSILLKKRQAAEVMQAGLEGLVSCPFCHFASIPPEGDKIFKCLNPECTKESCRLCKELSHVPLKCDEVMKAEKARHYIEEKMTEALARKCYNCQKSFFKEEGCNKITCVCGAMMCYLCDEPIKDYSHFRGQGSDDKNRCPLYSDTIRLDAVAVRKIAEKAQLEVMKMNPNVKIDTAGLLPELPRPCSGPHQTVIDADELPRRAQRALGQPPV